MKILKNKKIIIFSLIFLLILGLSFSGVFDSFAFEGFVKNREYFLKLVSDHYLLSVLSFISIYILIVIFALPFGGPMTAIGGFLFGIFPTIFYSGIGGTVGSILSILIFRYFLGRKIQAKYGHKLEKFNKNIEKHGGIYILIVQLVGTVPFFIVNILTSLTKISMWSFAWATFIGIIPANFIYAYAGRQLGTIKSFNEILSGKVLLAFALLALITLLSFLINKYKKSK